MFGKRFSETNMRSRILISVLTIFSIVGALLSCEKSNVDVNSTFGKISKDKYYSEEIFSEQYSKINGKWALYSVSGGFTGDGHKPNFEYFEVKEFGTYQFIGNDSTLEYGRIQIEEQTEFGLQVKLVSEQSTRSFIFDPEKAVYFISADSMNLISPCCDRYNYHFVREE